ncbi:hypothetical protein JCM10207_003384 [Rhodosporidiobolus poonsookiae]
MAMRTLNLNSRKLWSWRQAPQPALHTSQSTLLASSPTPASSVPTGFQPCCQFPSQIHAELLHAGIIPDPFLKRNEEPVQWVGEADWIYQCEFDVPKGKLPREGELADLVFEGLDTFATVFLNGVKILEADNMHRQYRLPVTSHLKPGRNTLYLAFHSAVRRARELEECALGRGKHWPCWNGDKSRLFVRKASFNFGWDWGPVLLTAGPYRPIRLEVYESRIFDFWPRAHVSDKLEATLSLSWQISSSSEIAASQAVRARLRHPDGTVVKTLVTEACGGADQLWRFGEDEVELWWTARQGKQPLYEVEVDLVDMHTGAVLHSISRKVGFRRLRLVREPLKDEPGETFLFELNNVPLFIGGSNWIPIDSVLTNADEARYRRWLELLVEGNQNMVRVWGGGVYEPDAFYRICDELGILVWQDLMFACGSYPAHLEDFRSNVKVEVEQVVKRLRDHPCLAIIAGNNEDYQIAESEKLNYDPEDEDGDWLATNFPARELYERVFPSIVEGSSDILYWPGSPWGGKQTTDPTEGDLHCWTVWHGSQEPYQKYGELGGRFVSEFGMEGAPDIRTIDHFLDSEASERFPQSRTMSYHNKADGFERRLACYLTENIRFGSTLEDYVFATQFIQSEALSTAFSAWRRKFKGGVEGASCSGALVWQLNDVWPCTSWSIVDYFLRPKPAYFAIKRALAPLAISGRRFTETTYPDRFSAAASVKQSFIELWAGNSHLKFRVVQVEVEAFELLSGKRVRHSQSSTTLRENRSTALEKFEISTEWDDPKNPIVVVAKLKEDKTGKVLSRVSLWPEPFKFLTFPSPADVDLTVSLDRRSGELTALARRPVKSLVFSFSTDVKLSDNALNLIPSEKQVVKVEGLTEETEVSWRYLGDDHSL